MFSTEYYLEYDKIPSLPNYSYPIKKQGNLIEASKNRYQNLLNGGHYKNTIDILNKYNNIKCENIVDFGGLSGTEYFLFEKYFKEIKNYIIIEIGNDIEDYTKEWNQYTNIVKYSNNFSSINLNIDIFYSRAALLYSNNPLHLLEQVFNKSPKLVMLFYGYIIKDIPSHYRIQYFKNHNIPIHLTNINDIQKIATKYNYKLDTLVKLPDFRYEIGHKNNGIYYVGIDNIYDATFVKI